MLKCESAKATYYKMRKYTQKYFCSLFTFTAVSVTAGYRLMSVRMTCVRQQNYRPTSTDVTEQAVI